MDIEGLEGAVARQGGGVVAYVELGIEEPDIGFDAGAACAEGGEEGDAAPVVVV